MGLYLAFACLGHLLSYRDKEDVSLGEATSQNRVACAMVVYGLLGFLYPCALTGYHLLLMGKGETTREYLASRRFPKAERHRPFTQGNFIKNWVTVLGRSRPPTYLHFKKSYQQGDRRFGSTRGQKQANLNAEAQGGGMEMKPVQGATKSFEGPTAKKFPKLETN